MNEFLRENILTVMLLTPLAGLAAVMLLKERAARTVALGAALLGFAEAVFLFNLFRIDSGAPQFIVEHAWLPQVNVWFRIGADGVSLALLLLTSALAPAILLWAQNGIRERARGFAACVLLLEFALFGVFTALDLVLFYIFWELALVPVILMILLWGGEKRVKAAVTFFIYTMAGSVLMLIGILYLGYAQSGGGPWNFDLLKLEQTARQSVYLLPTDGLFNAQVLVFMCFAIAFAIKAPLFPLHGWMAEAYVAAPSGGTALIAGALGKMAIFGFLRILLPLFPATAQFFAPMFVTLAVVSILYGALLALAQTDVKRLAAFSSMSHLGYIVLGIFTLNIYGASGSIVHAFNHGIIIAGLFLALDMTASRVGTWSYNQVAGGLARFAPALAVYLMFAVLGAVSLPGLSGFVGEILILIGAYKAGAFALTIALAGLVLGAVYILRMYQKLMFGTPAVAMATPPTDLRASEHAALIPLVALILLFGIYPQPFLKRVEPTAVKIIKTTAPVQQSQSSIPRGPVARSLQIDKVAKGENSSIDFKTRIFAACSPCSSAGEFGEDERAVSCAGELFHANLQRLRSHLAWPCQSPPIKRGGFTVSDDTVKTGCWTFNNNVAKQIIFVSNDKLKYLAISNHSITETNKEDYSPGERIQS